MVHSVQGAVGVLRSNVLLKGVRLGGVYSKGLVHFVTDDN